MIGKNDMCVLLYVVVVVEPGFVGWFVYLFLAL